MYYYHMAVLGSLGNIGVWLYRGVAQVARVLA